MTQHLDEGRLQALLDGEIPSGELAPIQAHLAACPECRAQFEEAREFAGEADQLLGMLDEEVPAALRPKAAVQQAPKRRWAGGLAWAATIVLAAGIGYMVRGVEPTPPSEVANAFRVKAEEPQPTLQANQADAGAGAPSAAASPTPTPAGRVVATQPATEPRRKEARADGPAPAPPPADTKKPAAPPATIAQLANDSRDTAAKDLLKRDTGTAKRRLGDQELRLEELVVTSAPEEKTRAPLPMTVAPQAAKTSAAQPEAGKALAATSALRGGAAGVREVAAVEVTLSDALQRLGGTLRLIEGLVPIRIEAAGPQVRVVYPLAAGELLLIEQLVDGKVSYRLQAPAGFPADSLERLKARVRE